MAKLAYFDADVVTPEEIFNGSKKVEGIVNEENIARL